MKFFLYPGAERGRLLAGGACRPAERRWRRLLSALLAPLALLMLVTGLALIDPDAGGTGLHPGTFGGSCSVAIALIALPALAGALWIA